MAKAHFRTNVLLKSIIGKDLITDDNIAVLELVKNSFDANSKKVDIVFKNIENNDDQKVKGKPSMSTSKIFIKDSGVGMDETDLISKWLNIAYSEKKQKKEEFGRVLAGNKGVGRFSCDKLGEFLNIYTRKLNNEIFHLFIDWKKFEIGNQIDLNIQDIDISIDSISESDFENRTGYGNFRKGTILEISKLREEWDRDRILVLKRYLEKLINPNQAFRKNAFEIEIIAKEYEKADKKFEDHNKVNGVIKNKIFEKLNFRTSSVEASIDNSGKTITTVLRDRGNVVFSLIEKNPYSLLKDIRVTIYYLNPYSKIYFAKQTGIRSVDFGSIFLFINGFRIPPYGDEGNDWLGLEIRKGQGHSRFLGTREVVGRVEINDENDAFKIISNREGVVNNTPFIQLTKSERPFGFFYKAFRRLERFVVEGIKWDSIPKDFEKDIETKINNDPSWDQGKEVFNETETNKSKRILSLIKKMLDPKSEIISLSVNEAFIEQIIVEQANLAQKQLEEIASKLDEKDLTVSQLDELIEKLDYKRNELTGISSSLDYEHFKTTSKINFDKLNRVTDAVESRHKEVIDLRAQLAEIEEEKEKIEQELEDEKKKNIFLLSTSKNLNNDTLGLVHHIQHETPKIDSEVETLISHINSTELKKKDILARLYKIKLYTNKVAMIGKLITRTNFNEQAKKQKIDLAKYIVQYVGIYKEISNSELSFIIIENNSSFITRVSAIEIAIIFDNLIHNSFKAGAKKVQIELKSIKSRLEVFVSDDGKGVHKQFSYNPSVIFDLGITSTEGSGIGLFTVRDLINKMNGEVRFIGNNEILRGATFKLVFKHEE